MNQVTITTNGPEYLELKKYATYNIWREFSDVTDPVHFHQLKSKCIQMGLTGLADEIQVEWEIVKDRFIKSVQDDRANKAVEFINNPSINLFEQLADLNNPNKHF